MASDAVTGEPVALVVLYDATCAFCVRCRRWLEAQPTWVELRFLPAQHPQARRMASHLPVGEELVVLGSDGSAWVGDDAFLVCLWATRRYRAWAARMVSGGGRHLARVAFRGLSSGRWLFGSVPAAECDDGSCRPPATRQGAP